MRVKFSGLVAAILVFSSLTAWGGTFGKVVSIGGEASDLVLDESRGVVYVANYTANRIEVLSVSSQVIKTSINVPSQPGALALSPDGRFLVIAHFANYSTPSNALTVIDLANSNAKQTFALSSAPLGLAFGNDGLALVVTETQFLLFDPLIGTSRLLGTLSDVVANSLPVDPATFPPQIVAAKVTASGDGSRIYGLGDTIMFRYDVATQNVRVFGYTSDPTMGPRTVTVNTDGSRMFGGWVLHDEQFSLVAQIPDSKGLLQLGSQVFDDSRGVIYAEIPEPLSATSTSTTGTITVDGVTYGPPILRILEAGNLTTKERLKLPEHLAGRAVLNSDSSVMYSISDSGVIILPVGSLDQTARVVANVEDVVFRGNFCNRSVSSQQILIYNPGGGNTAFTLSSSLSGVTLSSSSGTTPATITVSVDPTAFQNQKGTVSGTITIASKTGINDPATVRVLVNLKEPDQRGTVVDVPGTLVDVLADPSRNRFYVLRQDKNQVLVFDGETYTQLASFSTGNTPTQMAISYDRRYLMTGADNSGVIHVFDLDSLQADGYIRLPYAHYPRSIGVSSKAILAATRVAGDPKVMDRVDLDARTGTELASLGVWANDIDVSTVLQGTPNGSAIFGASADGSVWLYSASADTFVVSRKDYTALKGAYAASSYDQFVVGDYLLNSSLVTTSQFETESGTATGFAFIDTAGVRATSPGSAQPGIIARADVSSGSTSKATRMAESTVLPSSTTGSTTIFTRTLAPLANRSAIIALTVSGFTVLPWNYDTAVASPTISTVANAADGTSSLAPGGLVSITGTNLSPVNITTKEMPLPTALGESCLTVNGESVPMIFASSTLINAQLPYQTTGNVTMTLYTPGGVSDNFYLTLLPGAPAVFRNGTSGDATGLSTIVRASNSDYVTMSNPVHHNDSITIYLTGLGDTTPAIKAGVSAPSNPKAEAIIEPTVTLGGTALPVSFAGLVPGQVGVYQIDVTVPKSTPTGISIPLTISQGSGSTTLNVRVVD
jgi:uncharacterized protein (TIGR03437 family)